MIGKRSVIRDEYHEYSYYDMAGIWLCCDYDRVMMSLLYGFDMVLI